MPLRTRFIVLSLVSFFIVAVGGWFWWSTWRAAQEVRLAAEAAGRLETRSTPLAPPDMAGVTLWLDAAHVEALTEFRGQLYAATSGGLAVLDTDGAPLRHLTTADGLPDNDLTTLAVFRDRLFIGTRTAGLVEYDGVRFIQHEFRKPAAVHVSSLLATPDVLVIGMLDGGLYDYDGAQFGQRFQPPRATPITGVTALYAVGTRLFIGTLAHGLFIWRDGELKHVPPSGGLPSPHVTAFAWRDESLYVATDAGVVRLTQDEQLQPVSRQPNIRSLAVYDGKLYAGLVVGGIVEVRPMSQAALRAAQLSPVQAGSDAAHRQVRLAVVGERLLALTQSGVYAVRSKGDSGFEWRRFDRPNPAEGRLTSGNVTSLAFDATGRLWVGTFENGLDILDPDTGDLLRHIQDETVREINHLCATSRLSPMLAATSGGLVAFDAAGKVVRRYDAKSAALIGDAVSHVRPLENGVTAQALAVATAKGLTIWRDGVGRSLTAFHGLPSNYLYCCEMLNGKLYVGTLGGLAELDGLRVARTWRTDNSDLPANWINALLAVEDTLYIGTYGGGVCAMRPAGDIRRFPETKGVEINLNAMATDGERLYVGTLDRGLLVYDLRSDRWRVWRDGLPSANVTAIAVRPDAVFVGTSGGVARIEKRRFM
ncbi:MAG: hypothetical protein NZ585_13560 [Chloracidobacterium sp.]|nr:hypothetical protein [Chloracidobacterium sp.]MDW8218863.1 two-component regulator propeller domain-containing protein [Acidobacteriota bacterium]